MKMLSSFAKSPLPYFTLLSIPFVVTPPLYFVAALLSSEAPTFDSGWGQAALFTLGLMISAGVYFVLLGLLAELVVKVFGRSDRPLSSADGSAAVLRTGGVAVSDVVQPAQSEATVLVSNAAPDVDHRPAGADPEGAEIDNVLEALGSTLERLGYTWECILVFDGIKGPLWDHATALQEKTPRSGPDDRLAQGLRRVRLPVQRLRARPAAD